MSQLFRELWLAGVCLMVLSGSSADVLAQRETEVDFINGAIVREGERLGIDTPVNRTITNLVKVIEKTYSVRVK